MQYEEYVNAGSRLPEYKSWLHNSLAVGPWASSLTSLCTHFLGCNTEIIKVPNSEDGFEDEIIYSM